MLLRQAWQGSIHKASILLFILDAVIRNGTNTVEGMRVSSVLPSLEDPWQPRSRILTCLCLGSLLQIT